jgi:hypothetical protein
MISLVENAGIQNFINLNRFKIQYLSYYANLFIFLFVCRSLNISVLPLYSYTHLPFCLFVLLLSLSLCLSVCCLSMHLSLFVYLPMHFSVCPSVQIDVCTSVCPSAYLSACLCFNLSVQDSANQCLFFQVYNKLFKMYFSISCVLAMV